MWYLAAVKRGEPCEVGVPACVGESVACGICGGRASKHWRSRPTVQRFQRFPGRTIPTRRLHEASQRLFSTLTPSWVSVYQLPLVFDPPKELAKVQQVATFDQPKESVKVHQVASPKGRGTSAISACTY